MELGILAWLRKNITQLNQVLGLDIEITESEGTVDAFAVDLVGRDLGTGHTVIIETAWSTRPPAPWSVVTIL